MTCSITISSPAGRNKPPQRGESTQVRLCSIEELQVDLIVRKNSEYRHAEFERRKSAEFAGISTRITRVIWRASSSRTVAVLQAGPFSSADLRAVEG